MIRRALASLVLCLILLCAGIYVGAHPNGLPGFIRDPLVGDSDTRIMSEAIDTIHNTYYREYSKRDLSNRAIGGAVRSLNDRFSNYFDPDSYRAFKLNQNGQFAGIGVEVIKDADGLRIAKVYDNSPASAARLRAGDVITGVGATSLHGRSSDASIALIQGKLGTDVKITVRRGRDSRTVTLTRSNIDVPVVASAEKTVDGQKLGIIVLSQFSSGAHAEVAAALKRQLDDRVKGLVFDLRGNPGGLVTEAQLVASEFLKDGKIVTTKGRSVPTRTLDATGDAIAPTLPMVVLVDRNSASAAEIVSGALQDRRRAELVGTRTFGKGVFQEVIDLSNGGALDITAGQYFLPSGRNLGGRGTDPGSGLTPDVKAQDNPKTTNKDEGLDRALDVVAAQAR